MYILNDSFIDMQVEYIHCILMSFTQLHVYCTFYSIHLLCTQYIGSSTIHSFFISIDKLYIVYKVCSAICIILPILSIFKLFSQLLIKMLQSNWYITVTQGRFISICLLWHIYFMYIANKMPGSGNKLSEHRSIFDCILTYMYMNVLQISTRQLTLYRYYLLKQL